MYWHNDFGRAHSHGCVNVHPEAGGAYEDALMEVKEGGTPIAVT